LPAPESYIARVTKDVRARGTLRDDVIGEIVKLHVAQEDKAAMPLWEYKSEELVSMYLSVAIDTLQRERPELFQPLPTASDFVARTEAAGAVLSPEEKLSLARSVETMNPADLRERYESLGKAIQARQPAPQSESAIERYAAKIRTTEQNRTAANRAVHVEAERARMATADFNDLPPEQRLNAARKAQQNRG